MKKSAGIGVDMVKIARMRRIIREKRGRFIANTFTALEQKYCFAHRDSAPHFAGTFAAKEAVRKAASLYGSFSELEVRRTKEGRPEIWVRGRRAPSILVSITHTDDVACAVALKK
jgi:phosphopantetheine--protein transferase-like protein